MPPPCSWGPGPELKPSEWAGGTPDPGTGASRLTCTPALGTSQGALGALPHGNMRWGHPGPGCQGLPQGWWWLVEAGPRPPRTRTRAPRAGEGGGQEAHRARHDGRAVWGAAHHPAALSHLSLTSGATSWPWWARPGARAALGGLRLALAASFPGQGVPAWGGSIPPDRSLGRPEAGAVECPEPAGQVGPSLLTVRRARSADRRAAAGSFRGASAGSPAGEIGSTRPPPGYMRHKAPSVAPQLAPGACPSQEASRWQGCLFSVDLAVPNFRQHRPAFPTS